MVSIRRPGRLQVHRTRYSIKSATVPDGSSNDANSRIFDNLNEQFTKGRYQIVRAKAIAMKRRRPGRSRGEVIEFSSARIARRYTISSF